MLSLQVQVICFSASFFFVERKFDNFLQASQVGNKCAWVFESKVGTPGVALATEGNQSLGASNKYEKMLKWRITSNNFGKTLHET